MHGKNNWHAEIYQVRSLLVVTSISLVLLLIFVKLIVPLIIESAYPGESLPILNKIIEGRDTHPVSHYLQIWKGVAKDILVVYFAILGSLWAVLLTNSAIFFRRFVGEATPGSLGAIRMLTCAILLANTLWED